MILTIQNYTKVITTMYHSERFVCTYAEETPTNYRFQFRDNGSQQLRILWIEVSRLGVWDAADGGNWVSSWEERPACTAGNWGAS